MSARAILQSRLLNDPVLALAVATALAAGIAAIDYLTNYELRFGVLYLPPVFLATWGAGRAAGAVIGLTSAALWLVTLFVKHPYGAAFSHLWEGGLHLLMYLAFALVIARLKEALKLAEERFVSAFDSLDAAACVLDASGALLYSNPPFRRAFGEEVRGAAGFAARFGGALPEGEAFDLGSGRWYYVLRRAMRWLDGRSVRLHVATDISDAKRAEQLARQHQEQLQRTARLIAVGEMASTLAHELNQPLGAIANYNNGCIHLLKSWSAARDAAQPGADAPDASRLLELMEKCSAQALRAGDVVRRIREFVRRRPPELRPEDAGEMLSEALAAAESESPEVRAEVRLELEPGLPRLAADRMMIEKVIVNLARNALDAMAALPPAERKLAVRAARKDGAVEFQFRDCGCGVPPEAEERLFHPFLTTKPDGMGLGLAICRSIIEYHRGEMWYTRNPEGGSTFHFTLPAATLAAPPRTQ